MHAALLLPLFIVVIVVWSLVLKGFALWYAARGSQKGWYIVLLIINTAGILEIIYLIWFRPHDSGPSIPSTPARDSSAQA